LSANLDYGLRKNFVLTKKKKEFIIFRLEEKHVQSFYSTELERRRQRFVPPFNPKTFDKGFMLVNLAKE